MDLADQRNRREAELIDAMDRKIRAIDRALLMKDATIADLELKATALENTSYDGTLLWPITDFQRRRQEAVSGRVTSIYSPPFYTSRTGNTFDRFTHCSFIYIASALYVAWPYS